MTNNKILAIVFGAVIVVAGIGIYFLMNPPGGGAGPVVPKPYEDTIQQPLVPVIIPPGSNKHVDELSDQIIALEAAEWSKTDFEQLESKIKGKSDAGLITEDIAESLNGNLFNAYLITVKEAALGVIKTSSNLRDLYDSHSELKRLKGKVADRRVTEVTDMTHAIYAIPYYRGEFEESIAAGGLTDQELKEAADKLAGRIEGLPSRFELFKTSPLVKAVCRQGRSDLGRIWGEAIMTRNRGKVEGYVSREKYDDVKSGQYNKELTGYKGSRYLSNNSNFTSWVNNQETLLEGHRKADRRYEIGKSLGGTSDCSPFEAFGYYLELCKSSSNTGSSSTN